MGTMRHHGEQGSCAFTAVSARLAPSFTLRNYVHRVRAVDRLSSKRASSQQNQRAALVQIQSQRVEVQQYVYVAVVVHISRYRAHRPSAGELLSCGINLAGIDILIGQDRRRHPPRIRVDAVGVAAWFDIDPDLENRRPGL